jgi:hypothetical protein
MQAPRYLNTRLLRIGALDPVAAQQLAQRISAVPGVAETVVIAEDGVAYLKVDTRVLDEDALNIAVTASA